MVMNDRVFMEASHGWLEGQRRLGVRGDPVAYLGFEELRELRAHGHRDKWHVDYKRDLKQTDMSYGGFPIVEVSRRSHVGFGFRLGSDR
jgi:hypothetical protein